MLSLKVLMRPVLPALLLMLTPVPALAQRQVNIDLEEALRLAGVESPVIDISQSEIDIAKGNERQEGMRPNPEASVAFDNVIGSGIYSGLRSNEVTVMLTQPIELGGKRGARVKAARAYTDVAELNAQIMQADLALLVRQRFTDAVAAREKLLLAQDVLARNTELARIARELVNAGHEPPFRSLRADAAYGEAEAGLREAEANDLKARLALAELWGASTPPPSVNGKWLEPVNPNNMGDIPDALALQRANAELLAAEAVVEREKANAIPNLNVGAGIRRFQDSRDVAFTLGASMEIPLRNKNQGSIAAASASVRGAEARLQLARLQFQRERSSLIATIRAAQARVNTLANSTLSKTERALSLAHIGYRYGKFSLIDVLDAASARDEARYNLIKAREELAQATASLVRLTQRAEGIAQ